jgi:hypothetical protein
MNEIAREEEQSEMEPIHSHLGAIAEEQQSAKLQAAANNDGEEEQPMHPAEIPEDIAGE